MLAINDVWYANILVQDDCHAVILLCTPMLLDADLQFLKDFFSPNSPLQQTLATFQPRSSQLTMALAVAESINQQQHYLIEAGTGTGKTFAYLLPALLAHAPVIISTGTKHLQDQLLEKDLPTLAAVLPRTVKAVVLKGRNNYLCKHRLNLQVREGHFQFGPHREMFQHIVRWHQRTEKGDLNDIATASEQTPWWPAITSNTDNCLGKECPEIKDCFVYKNRKAALEADVVIINHHVLLANLALQREELSELLPKSAAVIVDEAHQLVDIVPQFFSDSVSTRHIQALMRDIELEHQAVGTDMPALDAVLQELLVLLHTFRQGFGESGQKQLWQQKPDHTVIDQANQTLVTALQKCGTALMAVAERSKGLDNCAKRAAKLEQQWRAMMSDSPINDISHWYETFKSHVQVTKTPLQIGDQFSQALQKMADSWVFTSATLTTDQQFHYFERQLGLASVKTLCLDSPFDYPRQALWYVPQHLPEPNDAAYPTAFLSVARQVLEASGGRAFVLFTSHKAMQQAAIGLKTLPYPVLLQGQAPKQVLLNQFRAANNAVLLGTQSFWEGVDVQGDALSCVIIDKLPFSVPTDPVHVGQIRALQAAGMNAFDHYHLPRAVITLKQGAGRLIRDVTDRGVLVVCDVRLIKRSYRRAFIKSLPPFKRTRDMKDVQAFFTQV